jgi:hypothetical protein
LSKTYSHQCKNLLNDVQLAIKFFKKDCIENNIKYPIINNLYSDAFLVEKANGGKKHY